MRSASFRDRYRAALIKGLVQAFAALPLPAAHRLGTALGWLALRLPNKATRTAWTNLKRCFPELSEDARRTLLKETLAETGKTFAEVGALWLWPEEKTLDLIRRVEGESPVKEAFKQGQGIILLSPHLGAWELSGLYCAAHYPLTILYRPPRISPLEAWIRDCRARTGGQPVSTREGIRPLYRALQRGEAVGILPDQDPGNGSGIPAPFFNIPARTMTLVGRLAYKTKASVFFVHAQRLPQGKGYVLRFSPAPPGIDDPDPRTAAIALNQGLEACIRRYPAQYQWIYKRFRGAPLLGVGDTLPTKGCQAG